MPVNYTPVASWGTDPVVFQAPDDAADATLAFVGAQTALNRALVLKNDADTLLGRFDASLLKLGLTVTGPSDTTPPTYGGSPYILIGNMTHQAALEAVDAELKTKNTSITNMIANIGGNTDNPTLDNYSSVVFVSNGDSHHVAIGKLDAALDTVESASSSASTLATTNSTRITNIVTKLGIDADQAAAWTYSNTNYIANGQTLKVNTEGIDRSLLGADRTAHRAFGLAAVNSGRVLAVEETITNLETFWDDFYDATKVDTPNTTATVDTEQQQVSGNSTVLVEQFTAAVTMDQIQVDWQSYGSVSVYANLIGSVVSGDYTLVPTKDTWVNPASGNGTGVVIKFEIGVGGILYNYHLSVKP